MRVTQARTMVPVARTHEGPGERCGVRDTELSCTSSKADILASKKLVQYDGKSEALHVVLRRGFRMKPLEPLTGSLLRDQQGQCEPCIAEVW
jgi:hypothetical protein